MRLTSKVKILCDNDIIKEVPGVTIPYERSGTTINLIVHSSEQPWTDGMLDVSEESTGRLCVCTGVKVPLALRTDVISAMDKFVQDKGWKNILKQIENKPLDKVS